MEKKRILVVEDDKDQAMALSIRLRKAGYQVLLAVDALQGTMQARQADLIVLDLGMPAGGGFALLENTRHIRDTSMIPIIVLTARDSAANKERALSLGAAVFFQKPADSHELMSAICQLLEYGEYTAAPAGPDHAAASADAAAHSSPHKLAQAQQWRTALRQAPGNPVIQNDLAWVLATARDPHLRNVAEAMQIAEQLLALAKSVLPAIWDPSAAAATAASPAPEDLVRRKELAMALLDTLAAVHAADGQFAAAADLARKGLALAQEMDLNLQAHEMSDRIRLYESGQPFLVDYP